MGKFKVGDLVRVKDWEVLMKSFFMNDNGDLETGEVHFTKEMRKFCGKECVISSCEWDDVYTLFDCEEQMAIRHEDKIFPYYFTDESLEALEKNEKKTGPRETFLQVKFARLGKIVSAKVLVAPPKATVEALREEGAPREDVFYYEKDGAEVYFTNFNELSRNAIHIAYADFVRFPTSHFVYKTEEEAKDAVRRLVSIIEELNKMLSDKAEITVTN